MAQLITDHGVSVYFGTSHCSSDLISLYDVIARLMSLSLQYGVPLEKVGDRRSKAEFTSLPGIWSLSVGDHGPRQTV